MTMFEMITEFHLVYGQAAPKAAGYLSPAVQRLRFDLIAEEFREYREAAEHGNFEAIAKEIADLVYVVIGTAVAHGFVRFDEIFAEVHRSNMSKLGRDGKPVLREDGKIMKGDDYQPPDIASLL